MWGWGVGMRGVHSLSAHHPWLVFSRFLQPSIPGFLKTPHLPTPRGAEGWAPFRSLILILRFNFRGSEWLPTASDGVCEGQSGCGQGWGMPSGPPNQSLSYFFFPSDFPVFFYFPPAPTSHPRGVRGEGVCGGQQSHLVIVLAPNAVQRWLKRHPNTKKVARPAARWGRPR